METTANDPTSFVEYETLFTRHNGNTFIIQLWADPTDLHADDVVYFTPALKTFAFTS